MSNPTTTAGVFVLTGSTSHRGLAEVVGEGTRMLGEALAAYHHRIGKAARRAFGYQSDPEQVAPSNLLRWPQYGDPVCAFAPTLQNPDAAWRVVRPFRFATGRRLIGF